MINLRESIDRLDKQLCGNEYFDTIVNVDALNVRRYDLDGEIVCVVHRNDKLIVRKLGYVWNVIGINNFRDVAESEIDYFPIGVVDVRYLTNITNRPFPQLEEGAVG